jgi:subtilisin family serine protease
MRRTSVTGVCILLVLAAACVAQTTRPWTQLSLSTAQVDAFRKANAEADGRGVVVAVLDTGVDMGVVGLTKTPAGEVKVIDAQDFSGEGDIEIARATWNETNDKIVRYGKDNAPEWYTPPPAEQRPTGTTVWFGVLKEEAFKNTSVSDVNDNGRKDDAFGACVISRDDGNDDDVVCYIDGDGDRDFSNERPLKNYKLNYDTFTFAREKKEKQDILLTCAVNILVRQRKIALHFDDGGHGTHVAGIATGHRIQGQEGFDGVAPGAKVISLKIGNNRLAGGATTSGAMQKAFEYAAKFAREHNVQVVCNLSYGVGSKREGDSDIDKFLDTLLRDNPYLIVCTSAGNEGPGLSSVGTPAAADAAISVAALLAADTARDVSGVQIPTAQVMGFSSRGGELDKPDIATPGLMTSTVPRWNRRGDFWGGTSMASPYAAGLCALLVQHVQAKTSAPARADWVKAALKNTADGVPGFTALDYGAGQPNIVKAAEAAVALAVRCKDDPLYAFKVSTESPMGPEGSGPAAYWRSPYFPADRPQSFTIEPLFVPEADAAKITEFSKRLSLRCNADWCKLLQDQIYFRDRQSATVRVQYDPAKLKEPGLYVATVEGLDGDTVALRLLNTIIVPHRAAPDDGYRVRIENQTVEGSKVRRHFIAVPTGASAMHVTLRAEEGKPSTAGIIHVHKPDGRYISEYPGCRLDTKNDKREARFTVSKELEPGVWELPVTSAKADETSVYSLEVRFDGVLADPEEIGDLSAAPGATPTGSVRLLNVFDRPTTVTMEGRIEGYRKTETKKLTTDEDAGTFSIAFTSAVSGARIRIKVSDEDYEKLTDAAVTVFDAGGQAIVQEGLNEPELTIHVDNPQPEADSTTCKLEVRPAFAIPNIDNTAEFEIRLDYLYKEPVNVAVKRGGNAQITLYPGIEAELSYTLDDLPPKAPDGTATVGYIRAIERGAKQPVAEVEIVGKKDGN